MTAYATAITPAITSSGVPGGTAPESPRSKRFGVFVGAVRASVAARMLPGMSASTVAIAVALAVRMDWSTGETHPGWEGLQKATGLSRSTVARQLRLLRAAGLICWSEQSLAAAPEAGQAGGRQLPRALADFLGRRGDASVYICMPGYASSDPVEQPASSPTNPAGSPPAEPGRDTPSPPATHLGRKSHAREAGHRRSRSLRLPRKGTARRAGYDLARAVQHRGRLGPLGQVTLGWLMHLMTPLAAAGWTPSDVFCFLDGRPLPPAVRHPRHWLSYRLTEALAQPAPSQQRAAAHAVDRERSIQFRADLQAQRARATSPEAQLAREQVMAQARARLGPARVAPRPRHWVRRRHLRPNETDPASSHLSPDRHLSSGDATRVGADDGGPK